MNNNQNRLNVLIVGAGMYVSGKNTNSYGTILPALNELYLEKKLNQVYICATSEKSIKQMYKKVDELKKLTGSDITVLGFPKEGNDSKSFVYVIQNYQIDCAILSVPDQYHFKIAMKLIDNGIHLLVVKPLTSTLKESKALISSAKRNNIYGAVEFHKRYDLANLKLKDYISSNAIGDILYIHVEYSQRITIPLKVFSGWIDGTNIFQYLGVHYVDIIYFVTEYTPSKVLATGQKKILASQGINNFDSIQVMIEWESNNDKFISTFLTNWIDPITTSAMSDQKIKIVGTSGRIESDQKDRGFQIVNESLGVEHINPYFNQEYPKPGENAKIFRGYGIDSIQQFCYDILEIKSGFKSVDSFKYSRPTFQDSICSTAVVEAVNKSLKTSEWIKVSL